MDSPSADGWRIHGTTGHGQRSRSGSPAETPRTWSVDTRVALIGLLVAEPAVETVGHCGAGPRPGRTRREFCPREPSAGESEREPLSVCTPFVWCAHLPELRIDRDRSLRSSVRTERDEPTPRLSELQGQDPREGRRAGEAELISASCRIRRTPGCARLGRVSCTSGPALKVENCYA